MSYKTFIFDYYFNMAGKYVILNKTIQIRIYKSMAVFTFGV